VRVLHIYKDYHPVLGGIENHIQVLAEAQAAAGHEVTVLVCAPGWHTQIETRNGVRIVKAGRLATVASMPLSISQPLALLRMQPDVVHVQSPYPLGEVMNLLVGRARATVITYQSDVVRQRGWLRVYGPLLRRVLRSADRIIATSPRYIESSAWLAPVRHKCTVVPLGIDISRFMPAPTAARAAPLRLLFVGRLRYYKGLDVLLRALTHLPEAQLDIVGTGPMQRTWQTLAGQLGLHERVRFVGDVEDADLPAWYRRADLFVLPATARSEAFGLVLLEAMACGLPCISTELGTGTSWIVQDGVTGRVVPPGDVEALANALGRLMDDPSKRSAMGRAGRERVEHEFTKEDMVRRVESVYADVLRKD